MIERGILCSKLELRNIILLAAPPDDNNNIHNQHSRENWWAAREYQLVDDHSTWHQLADRSAAAAGIRNQDDYSQLAISTVYRTH